MGKSFLANQILKRMKGFNVVAPNTRITDSQGIWVWSNPINTMVISDNKEIEVSCIIMDCEGLGDDGSF